MQDILHVVDHDSNIVVIVSIQVISARGAHLHGTQGCCIHTWWFWHCYLGSGMTLCGLQQIFNIGFGSHLQLALWIIILLITSLSLFKIIVCFYI